MAGDSAKPRRDHPRRNLHVYAIHADDPRPATAAIADWLATEQPRVCWIS